MMRLSLLFTLLIGGLAFTAQAQPTVNGRFQSQINPGAGIDGQDQLQVTVELAADPGEGFDLGTSTLMFTYNSAALTLPSEPIVNGELGDGTDYTYVEPYVGDPGNGFFYGSSDATLFGAENRIALNIVLDVVGFGQSMPESFTPVVELFFHIEDPTATADLQWILPNTGDSNPTAVKLDDNSTNAQLGIFQNDTIVLPVELVEFTAQADGEAVQLRWATASETNNAGFEVQMHAAVPEKADGASWQPQGWVDGWGTTAEPQQYAYRVDGVTPGTHRFRLKQVDFDGTFAYSPEVEVTIGLDAAYRLTAPYPNPFNPEARFSLMVRRAQHVEVAVYDALGRRVRVLHDGSLAAGTAQAFVVEGHGLQSGVYFIRAVGEAFVATRRATLVK